MKILIAGDMSLQDRAAKQAWNSASLISAFADIPSLAAQNDYAIVNLESPITENVKPIVKDGPTLKNNVAVFEVVNYCSFGIVTLANNHLKDYGCQGVLDTIQSCQKNELLTVGAGANLTEARKPLILRKDRLSIGILNVCEHEFSIATNVSAGAAPLELTNLFYDIKELHNQVDKVIVIVHGGCEHYQLPTPRMKREYRLIVDFGADVVVNHHQHCYSGYEIYNGKPIFYGLGNFFFDNPSKRNDKWNEGLLLKLEITKEDTRFELIPYNQCDADPVIKIREYNEVKEKIEELNSIIADDKILSDCFDHLVASKKPLCPFLPYGNHYLRALYNRGLLPSFMRDLRKVKIKNAVSCESHREVLLHSFERLLNNEQLLN